MTLEPLARAICNARGLTFVGAVGAGASKETFEVALPGGASQALKVYQPGTMPERAERETMAMKRCQHPNIVRLFAIEQHPHGAQSVFFSLEEFLSGGTLASRLTNGRVLSPADARAIGAQLISALGHIASHDIVHRDLKPENIMFRADGITPVVVDFGLVRVLGARSLTQTWLVPGPGTPLYAPPEQLNNEKSLIDWRADQFSLGVLLSIVTLGWHPYQDANDSLIQAVTRVAQRSPAPSRFANAAASARLRGLVKMTALWPVQRYRTPKALADAWAAM